MTARKEALTFKNGQLVTIGNTLAEFKLKGRASLGRTWLINHLVELNKQFNADQLATQKNFFKTDENGEFVYKQDKKTLILKDGYTMDEAQKEFDQLLEEPVSIEISSYSARMKALFRALEDYPYELEGQTALVYALVFEQFDKAYGKGE
ncbi:hypothetical protein Nizo2535_3109 [Lactiplantibacillus plantarum]|uniref:DUF1617 family protein n=1 Tax=Lactiplantibacillus plantarum TaxID=1590 RepID=UPI0007B56103|nr:DUF1617 family protein [Lactiplantibacillus plantarum]KZU26793.1 hypothetical protein Nizo2535_3109 [Lactiplantibacillus plantarum]KZU81474.1 hypothetical protein Nizo2891_0511 [Lactiplantibacillus plantarum]RDD79088.1 DUF1617 family protein [Lactiplantibacillus plantarum]